MTAEHILTIIKFLWWNLVRDRLEALVEESENPWDDQAFRIIDTLIGGIQTDAEDK